jgi:hypothetical protein
LQGSKKKQASLNKRNPFLLDKHEGYNGLPEKSENEQEGENKNKPGK